MITDKQVEVAVFAQSQFSVRLELNRHGWAVFDNRGGKSVEVAFHADRQQAEDAVLWHGQKAALEAAEKAAWRPISEAKSGQTVLAGYRNSSGKWRTVRAEFIGKFTREHTEECGLDPDYSEEADTFYWPEGWYERIESWDDFTHLVMHKNPTHFRPLPKGPSDE